jgi:anti-sigma B factor antagonist
VAELARIDAECVGTRCVVRVRGEIDISNAADVAREIERSIASDCEEVVVDLAATAYLDSSGISLLIRLAERLRATRQRMQLVVPEDSPIRGIIELTALPQVMPVATHLQDRSG